MISWLIVAQLAGAPALIGPANDSSYATPALRTFVTEAAQRNRQVPMGLTAYRATAESEIAIVGRRAEGMEGVISLEQLSSDVRWRRPGDFEQRVTGYRNQALGFQLATLSFLRQPWAVPILYGDRLSILFGTDTSRAARRRAARSGQRTLAVHPLAGDRDRYYRYHGGDTVVTMRVGDRELPIVRVVVEPRPDAPERSLLFRGELDLDATRQHLVRMRGYFVETARRSPTLAMRAMGLGGFVAVAFVELENGEFMGDYWLPVYQRFEAQVSASAASDARSVFRIITRYRAHQVNDSLFVPAVDSLVSMPFRLRVAPMDSLRAFREWRREIGDLTGSAHADDFNDIAPDIWRPTGRPLTRWRVQRVMDALHVNRVEGVYTGWGLERRFRDQFPGLTVRGNAGWAWSEQVVRGRASAELSRGAWTTALRGGRSLDITNDFRATFDSGSTVATLFGQDNYDYVDRQLVALGVHRRLGKSRSIWRLETGPARDQGVVRTISRVILRPDSGFRENRGVDAGRYWRTWSALEWRPDVSAEFMRTGLGGLVTVEHARGDLDFTRLDARVVGRRNAGRWTGVARADAGLLLGDRPPPQQLYEVGQNQNLQGYGYKEFVGDRALVARALAMWRLPMLEAPVRVRRFVVPGPSPALAVGLQGAITSLSSAGARQANLRLSARPVSGEPGAPWVPTSQVTDGVRTSVTLGLRFFGGSIGVGLARPLERHGAWRLRLDVGQVL